MARVFISLGSNLGDRLQYLQRAVDAIAAVQSVVVRKISSVYETEPVGVKNQPEFFNAVVELDAAGPPREFFRLLKKIEKAIGRTKTERWGPREIDLDLLYYGAETLNESELTIPHPELRNRRFVLEPLTEIAGEFLDPNAKKPVWQLLSECADSGIVKKTSFALTMKRVY